MMNMIWRCPHCGGSLDSAGHCPCGHGQPETEVQITFVPPVPTGWKCPQCGRIHAPFVSTCPFCAPHCQPFEITWIGTTPNTWQSDGTSQPAGGGWDSITVGDPCGSICVKGTTGNVSVKGGSPHGELTFSAQEVLS